MPKNNRKSFRGFTLIELLVVLVILGILATIGLTSFVSTQMKSRDSERKSDLKQVAGALELYYADYESYPPSKSGFIMGCSGSTSTPCPWGSEFTDGKTTYMKFLPVGVSERNYYYRSVSVNGIANQGFQIFSSLENPQDINCMPDEVGQPNCAKPVLPDDPSITCGPETCNFAVTSPNVSPAETGDSDSDDAEIGI